jgi:hypothetical protein
MDNSAVNPNLKMVKILQGTFLSLLSLMIFTWMGVRRRRMTLGT